MTTQIIFRHLQTQILEASLDENTLDEEGSPLVLPNELQGINYLIRDFGESATVIKSSIDPKTIRLDKTCNHITGEDLGIHDIKEINFIPKSQYTGKEFE